MGLHHRLCARCHRAPEGCGGALARDAALGSARGGAHSAAAAQRSAARAVRNARPAAAPRLAAARRARAHPRGA
eukprot:7383365-Prymnesium_polylepis.1